MGTSKKHVKEGDVNLRITLSTVKPAWKKDSKTCLMKETSVIILLTLIEHLSTAYSLPTSNVLKSSANSMSAISDLCKAFAHTRISILYIVLIYIRDKLYHVPKTMRENQ